MEAVSRAAWLLAAGLLLWPLRPAPALPPECAEPASRVTAAGHTRQVDCSGGPHLQGPARLLFGQRLDPNRADPASLETLPGIGPARAAAIVAERERRGFDSLEDLQRVHGIGPRRLEALRPWLRVAPLRGPES